MKTVHGASGRTGWLRKDRGAARHSRTTVPSPRNHRRTKMCVASCVCCGSAPRRARSHCADHHTASPQHTHTRFALAQHGPNVALQAWDVKPAPKAVQLTRASVPSSSASGLSCKTMPLSGRPGSAQVAVKLDEENACETAGAGLAQDSAGGMEQVADDGPAAAGARGSAPGQQILKSLCSDFVS